MRRICEEIPAFERIKLTDFDFDLDYYLQHRYDEIGEASHELPIVLEYVSQKLQDLIEAKFIKKHRIKEAEGAAYFALKKGDFIRKGYGEKATDAAVEHAVALDENVIKAYQEFAVLSGWAMRLQNIQANLETKLNLLRTFEATRRKLIEDEP